MAGVNPNGNLRGKVALVTGASRGIGAAIARAFAAEQATVAAGGRVVSVQPGIGTLVADVPCPSALEASPAVACVDADFRVKKMSLGTEAAGQAGAMSTVVDAIGARDLDAQALGEGVDRGLERGVGRGVRHGPDALDRREVDDAPPPTLLHGG